MTAQETAGRLMHGLRDEEIALLNKLRHRRRAAPAEPHPPTGTRIADMVAGVMGSWPFIIIQTVLLAGWIALNVVAWMRHWDPYPFVFLNLALSFQAAYAAPFIMMSQNRQADIDRVAAHRDYDVNLKAALEIELLHAKIDTLRENEIAELISIIRAQQQEKAR